MNTPPLISIEIIEREHDIPKPARQEAIGMDKN